MPKIVTAPAAVEVVEMDIFTLLKSTSSVNNEVLVPLTQENAKQVGKKDRIIALFCQDYGLIPTFTSRKWDNGTTSLLVSKETVDQLLAELTA